MRLAAMNDDGKVVFYGAFYLIVKYLHLNIDIVGCVMLVDANLADGNYWRGEFVVENLLHLRIMVALDVLWMQTGSRETMSGEFLAEIIDANERARTATRQYHLLNAAFNYRLYHLVAVFVEGVVK
jgi:hypothetical protein